MDDILPDNPGSPTAPNKSFPLKIIVLLIMLIIIGTLGTVFYPVIKQNLPFVSPTQNFQKQILELNSISSFLDELSSPLNPKLSQEEFESKKRSVQSEIQAIQNDLENNDLEAARKKIYRTGEVGQTTTVYGLFGSIINLGDPLQEKLVSQDIKQKHDPKDKYIKRSRVDPRIYNPYLSIVNILVETDKNQ